MFSTLPKKVVGWSVQLLFLTLLLAPANASEPPLKKRKLNGCEWVKGVDTTPPEKNPPVIFERYNNNIIGNIVHPVLEGKNRRVFRIAAGSDLTIACPPNVLINVKCKGDGKLEQILNDNTRKEIDIIQLDCNHGITDSIVDKGPCGPNNAAKEKDIGFHVLKHFHPLITVCFDTVTERTLWTEHTILGKNIAATKSLPKDPSWKHDTLFSSKPNIDQIYTKSEQDKYMKTQLKQHIIDTSGGSTLSLAKGHMSPAGDFTTEAEIRATYHYMNAVPQWHANNNGKWKSIEESTRDFAAAHRTDLRIISGGYGEMKLDNKKTKPPTPTKIFLGKKDSKGPYNKVPIPELLWKVVVQKSTNKAVAFVVINNPFLDKGAQSGSTLAIPTPICTDICNQITWLKNYQNINNNNNELEKGYTYCCEVNNALKASIPYIPNIGNIAGILK